MMKFTHRACFGISLILIGISGCTLSSSIPRVPQGSGAVGVPTQSPSPVPAKSPLVAASPKPSDNPRSDSSQLNFQDAGTEAMFRDGKINLSVMQSAQLSAEQAKTLISLTNANATGRKFRIILPRFVPEGYFVYQVEVSDQKGIGLGPGYKVRYRNKDSTCFNVTGFQVSGAGPETVDETVKLSSPILGQVVLAYTKFNQNSQGSLINFKDFVQVGDLSFEVNSSSGKRSNGCKTAPIKQIIEIINSLDFLENRTREQEMLRQVTMVPVAKPPLGKWYERSTVFTKNYRFDFPQTSCGDSRFQQNLGHIWYPIFVNGDNNYDLERINEYRCRDAKLVVRRKTRKSAIVVASFASLEKATDFATVVQGEVGEPDN